MSQISTKWIGDDQVTKEKVNQDVAGDGLEKVSTSTAITVKPDVTGGANLAEAINVSANGVAVKVDGSTIDANGSSQLYVPNGAIGPTQIDLTAAYTWTGSHDFTAGAVHVATPTSDTHAVNKAYADALFNGKRLKDPVKALEDGNLASLSGLPSNIDGVVSWSDGDRVLLNGQTTASENGIWVVHTGLWTRPTDFDTGDEAAGASTWVNMGVTYGDTEWTCATDPPNDIIDTDNLAFVQTNAGSISAGVGLTKNGSTLNVGSGVVETRGGISFTADDIAVAPDGATLEVDGVTDQVQVKDLGITTGKIAADAVDRTKINADVAGTGLTQEAGGELGLDIPGLTDLSATPAVADSLALYDADVGAHREVTIAELSAAMPSGATRVQEMHLVTAGDVAAGYFTLGQNPLAATQVFVTPVRGPGQVNKQCVGATGVTPDFDVLSTNQLHVNNNGAASGLSAHIGINDVLIIDYMV